MIPAHLRNRIKHDDLLFKKSNESLFDLAKYNPAEYYKELTRSDYYRALVTLRHYIKLFSDYYFSFVVGAKNIDLFMLTPSISSPMGPGSDSKPIPIKFGKFKYLVDSSQFGFEPLLLNDINKVYCYLPSMRGEDPDERHINQFFHCETEIVGNVEEVMVIAEEYVKYLSHALVMMPNISRGISLNYKKSLNCLKNIMKTEKFPRITFNEAVEVLEKNGYKNMIKYTSTSRDITSVGEYKLTEILEINTPLWITNYDRDRVPFYQKPDPDNLDKTLSADLVFPPLTKDSIGGEVIGCGQRQNNVKEMRESLRRQKINSKPYEWYIELRKHPEYQTTSGFGLGIERFIAWGLCRHDIKDVTLYPRLKNMRSYP
ncbi:amino acid--tRNA ligase-related protein [Patescibacteria group bacterium]